jgi:hypothetical protein
VDIDLHIHFTPEEDDMQMPKMDQWIQIMLQLAMYLTPAIQAAEVAFSGVPQKSGAAKKQLVLLGAGMTSGAAVSAGLITAGQQTLIMNTMTEKVEEIFKIIKDAKGFPSQWDAAGAVPTP